MHIKKLKIKNKIKKIAIFRNFIKFVEEYLQEIHNVQKSYST
jgi:hypothetical protein